jgi:hypothetical protein
MSRFDSWHRKISTRCHFQNGHHNTAQIQHCPISTTFHMWVDYDVPKWFLTSKNICRSPFQNVCHNTAQIQHCSISTFWIDSRHWKISSSVNISHFNLLGDHISKQITCSEKPNTPTKAISQKALWSSWGIYRPFSCLNSLPTCSRCT